MTESSASDSPPGSAGSGPQRASFRRELADAVSLRTTLLVVGVLLLQLGFILSYVGAFHAPRPHRIPIAAVAPPRVIGELNELPSGPLRTTGASSETAARARLQEGSVDGVYIVGARGGADQLLVASGAGASLASALEEIFEKLDASRHRTIAVSDVVALQAGDYRGLTGFYLVIGWLVGGYLVASLLGVAKGARPANLRRALIRVLAVVPYAILSGLGGAIVVDQLLGALTGHLLALWWLGALLVFGAATVTMAFQVLLGVLGIGVTVLLFVVLGNPSAGGAYQAPLLPGFWRAISSAIPNGAGVQSVRQIVYFGGRGIADHILLIAGYALGGILVTFVGAALAARREQARPDQTALV